MILRAYKHITANKSGVILMTVPVNAVNATVFDIRVSYEAWATQVYMGDYKGPVFGVFVKDKTGALIYRFTPSSFAKNDTTGGTMLITNNYTKLNPGDTVYVSCTLNQGTYINVYGQINYETL